MSLDKERFVLGLGDADHVGMPDESIRIDAQPIRGLAPLQMHFDLALRPTYQAGS